MAAILASVWWTRSVQYYDETAPVPAGVLEYAPWPRRIASALIDLLVIAAISLPFVVSTLGDLVTKSGDLAHATNAQIRTLTIFSIVVQVVYFTAMHAWRGSTLGKMAARTMLVREDGSAVNASVTFTRAVALVGINFVGGFLLGVPAVFNMLRPVWTPRRQTWHDQIARTVVVLNTGR
jgi:uncharacterized RDD family membrane protein YckC